MAKPLTTEILFNMPDDQALVWVQTVFLQQLQYSVREYFFSLFSPVPEPWQWPPVDPEFVSDLASAFICSAISRSSLYGFAATINQSIADQFWQNTLREGNSKAVTEGKSLYDSAFEVQCKDSNFSFYDFVLDGAQKWAQQLSDFISSDAFITTTLDKMTSSSNPDVINQLNLALYKIQRLDLSRTAAVLQKWRQSAPAVPLVEDWAGRCFIPAANFLNLPDQFLSGVNASLAEVWGYNSPTPDDGTDSWSQPIYGSFVAYGFLGVQPPYPDIPWTQDSRVRQLGFLSGAPPQNLGPSSTEAL